ncbi:hypothetical protein GCM10022226_65210 [Sphaerisporangium flaviroseum]|uniref:ATP-grasp-modified RiPP n=1 Tax=Sphaerisporangium flaviroseum TaxID=509199 RepID=A0ABP7J4W3_9ACTN
MDIVYPPPIEYRSRPARRTGGETGEVWSVNLRIEPIVNELSPLYLAAHRRRESPSFGTHAAPAADMFHMVTGDGSAQFTGAPELPAPEPGTQQASADLEEAR